MMTIKKYHTHNSHDETKKLCQKNKLSFLSFVKTKNYCSA